MTIDILASVFIAGLLDPVTGGHGWVILLLCLAIFFIGWLYGVIRLAKSGSKSKGGMWATLLIGLFISFLIGWIASMFIDGDKN